MRSSNAAVNRISAIKFQILDIPALQFVATAAASDGWTFFNQAYGVVLPRRAHGETQAVRRLDAIDRHILRELQEDGRMTNVELAKRVGISAPPCLRRVRALEEAGYIRGYRALLNENELGCEVIAFAMVHLSSQAEADLQAFESFVRSQPLVRECWMLSGEIDFILKCVAPNLPKFQAFVTDLTAVPHVLNVKTTLTLRNSKDAPIVPMELLRSPST
jgi:DNA-binding Lrp family transcriptional regulator